MGEAKRRAGRPNPRRLTVTVCIPSIPERKEMLLDALESVDRQIRRPERIVVELDPDRTGAAQTRNRALEKVTTDVVAWLDDDDRFDPPHLMACMRVLEREPDTDLVYPAPRMVGGVDPTATMHQGRFPVSPWGLRFGDEQAAYIRNHGSFIPITHLVRTDIVRRAGGFPEGRHLPDGRYQAEDEGYLIRLLDAGAVFEHLPQKTWRWYVNPRSTAGKPGGMR